MTDTCSRDQSFSSEPTRVPLHFVIAEGRALGSCANCRDRMIHHRPVLQTNGLVIYPAQADTATPTSVFRTKADPLGSWTAASMQKQVGITGRRHRQVELCRATKGKAGGQTTAHVAITVFAPCRTTHMISRTVCYSSQLLIV